MSSKLQLKKELSQYSNYQLQEVAIQEEDLERAFVAQLIIEERAAKLDLSNTSSFANTKPTPVGSSTNFATGCLTGGGIVTIVAIAIILAILGVIVSFFDAIFGIFL